MKEEKATEKSQKAEERNSYAVEELQEEKRMLSDRALREQRRRKREEQRKKQLRIIYGAIGLTIVLLILLVLLLFTLMRKSGSSGTKKEASPQMAAEQQANQTGKTEEEKADSSSAEKAEKDSASDPVEIQEEGWEEILSRAEHMAVQYDYEGAISLLKNAEGLTDEEMTKQSEQISVYQAQQESCVAFAPEQVTHVFFHTLIKDDAKAFDGDAYEAGYNQVMTTISEFNSMIQQMYDRGYVMVSMHDMCQINEDGTVTPKEILLPEGKTPFVLSQDDVSYYHYMDGDGFAQKLIVDDNGEVKNTYLENDGSISIGDYDMVPLIDTFVKEHPDFSFHGHKGIIALTGYEGVLGYRTDEVYKTRQADRVTTFQQTFFDEHPDFDYEEEVRQATEVATVMKENGWEFASHTWGHINPISYGYDTTVTDTQRWNDYVKPIVGDTDVLIFAFGADIGDWHPYTDENDYFTMYKSYGFHIFCNVDSSTYWVQFGDDYMRMARRNLDGYRMYYNPEKLTDLFDVEEAWDSNRPTPVPAI